MKNIFKLIISLAICQIAGLIGSIFTSSSVSTWYVELNKASFNPPNWIFAPVWTILFILMGLSLYFVWKKNNKKAITLFSIQLILNILWSVFFFGLRSPLLAFIEIIILWIFILLTILKFRKVSKTASYLLWPYLLWVTFAGILNFSIFLLN